jgi:hypothetical protein
MTDETLFDGIEFKVVLERDKIIYINSKQSGNSFKLDYVRHVRLDDSIFIFTHCLRNCVFVNQELCYIVDLSEDVVKHIRQYQNGKTGKKYTFGIGKKRLYVFDDKIGIIPDFRMKWEIEHKTNLVRIYLEDYKGKKHELIEQLDVLDF